MSGNENELVLVIRDGAKALAYDKTDFGGKHYFLAGNLLLGEIEHIEVQQESGKIVAIHVKARRADGERTVYTPAQNWQPATAKAYTALRKNNPQWNLPEKWETLKFKF